MTKHYYTVEHNYFSAGILETDESAFDQEDKAREWALDRLHRLKGSVYINGVHWTARELKNTLPVRKEA